MIKIINIKINYTTRPLGIDCDIPPLFSWEYAQCFNLKQAAYRLVITAGKKCVWDSDWVQSDITAGIEYSGEKLEAQTFYTLNIYTRTNQGEAEGVSGFETALEPADWRKLPWVVSSLNSENSSSLIRSNINIGTGVKYARVYIAAIGLFEFYVNGKKVDEYFMNPVITDTEYSVKYCVYDVTPFLKDNNNAIGIFISQGWTDLKRFKLIFDVFYEDGTKKRYNTDNIKFWEIGGPVTHSTIYYGEDFDGNLAEKFAKWSTTDFLIDGRKCYADWGIAQRVEDRYERILQPQNLRGMTIKEKIKPVRTVKKSENSTVYVFDTHFSGWVRIRVKGEKNAKIILQYAELALENDTPDLRNLRMAKCRDTYILSGNGEEEYAPRFTYRGFCYVQITIEGNAKVLSVIGEYVKTDIDQIGHFKCSNEKLNRLHRNILYTEGGNQNGTLTDCNQRNERFGWLNDLCSRIYQVVNNFDMSSFFGKIMEDIRATQNEEGAIADTAPNYFIGRRPGEPAAVCYLLCARFLYERYGNRQIIDRFYHSFEKLVDYFYSKTEDGILYETLYGDWVPPYPNHPKDIRLNIYSQTGAFSTAIMYWYLSEMVKLAEITGNKEGVKKYSEEAAFVCRKFNEKFFNAEIGAYDSGTQTVNALPLDLGMIPDDKKKSVYDCFVNDIKKHDNHSTCGNITYVHLFNVLMRNGDNELIEKVLLNPEYPGWGHMLEMGAISVWERWEKNFEHLVMQSLSHPMFGSYDAWFYHGLGGIRFNDYCRQGLEFTLKPEFNSDINFVECSILTINGKIESNWKREGENILYSFIVPSNTEATVILPYSVEKLPDGISGENGRYRAVSGSYTLEMSVN